MKNESNSPLCNFEFLSLKVTAVFVSLDSLKINGKKNYMRTFLCTQRKGTAVIRLCFPRKSRRVTFPH